VGLVPTWKRCKPRQHWRSVDEASRPSLTYPQDVTESQIFGLVAL